MESILTTISFTQQNYDGVGISAPLCEELGISTNQTVQLCLGEHSVTARVKRIFKATRQIWLTAAQRKKLVAPFPTKLHVRKEGDKIVLGPVVGILTTGLGNASPRTPFFRHLLSAAPRGEGVYYFVFTPHDVDWTNKTVNGYFIQRADGVGLWKRYTVAFPDVIYNRIPNRTAESLPYIRNFKKKVQQQTKTRVFNSDFFNKWTIHQKLFNHPDAVKHIPETHHSPSFQTMRDMLSRHNVIYLKPTGGSKGMGIVKVTRHPNHGFFCRYNQGGENVLRRFPDLHSLVHHMFSDKRKMGRYLAQQGISLMKVAGRPVDFRVHLHKTRDNRWIVSAIAAKAAGRGSVTTHVRTGGTVLSSTDALRYAFGAKANQLHQQIKETTIKLAEALEETLGENLGELGFDIGVDQRGHIWMFEANSKPGRHIFKHPSLRKADLESIRHILDYSYYLAQT